MDDSSGLRFVSVGPNPFSSRTTIVYELPVSSVVKLRIYDVAGRRVATLVDGSKRSGRHVVTWDGRGHDGSVAASGLYFARLEAGGDARRSKILLTR